MTGEAIKLKREYRYWLLAGALLLAVAVAGLCFRPGVDDRLIGLWEREVSGGVFVLQSSGQFEHITRDGAQDDSGLWWVEGDRLILRQRSAGFFNRGVLSGLVRAVDYLRRRTDFTAYHLFSVSDDVVHLKWAGPTKSGRDMILTRIDELPPPRATRRKQRISRE